MLGRAPGGPSAGGELLFWPSVASFIPDLFQRLEPPAPQLTQWPYRPLILRITEPSSPRAGFGETRAPTQSGCQSRKMEMSFLFVFLKKIVMRNSKHLQN